MFSAIHSLMRMMMDTASYYGCFAYFLIGRGRKAPYETFQASSCPFFRPQPNDEDDVLAFKKYARAHVYSLALVFYLWDKPHYRKGSYRDDLADNLRNVAIPGTGVKLSIFVQNKVFALWLLLVAYPVISLIAALHLRMTKKTKDVADEYATRLLAPDDWFSYWRLNCRVAALHAFLNDVPNGYHMENKWTFLNEGQKLGVPVSPFLTTAGVVVKHRNEEGGMGIFFYKNATAGGDWIIQEVIMNSDWVSSLLPKNAPLSTFRVITQSRASLDLEETPQEKDITALSCVFRAGRDGAATDHDSILFDIDTKSGTIKKGTTNAHWYILGLQHVLPGGCPWTSEHESTHHPDGHIPISGKTVPDIRGMLHIVETSHLKLCPDVPLVGWDVVLSANQELPVCLLEVNLSCNFFRGSFDKKLYVDFIDDAFVRLHKQRFERSSIDKKFK